MSDGELCYDIVRYDAVLMAGLCSWLALCRNVVVVRDVATQSITSCCYPHSGMAFFLLSTGNDGESWVPYSWAWAVFLWLLVPFSGIDDYGDVAFAVGQEWPILWLISSIFLRGTC